VTKKHRPIIFLLDKVLNIPLFQSSFSLSTQVLVLLWTLVGEKESAEEFDSDLSVSIIIELGKTCFSFFTLG